MFQRGVLILILVPALALALTRCAREDERAEGEPTEDPFAVTEEPAPGGTMATPLPGPAEPGGSPRELLAEVRRIDQQIGTELQQGHLDGVVDKAERIQTLVVAAAERSQDLPQARRTELDRHVQEVKTSSNNLAVSAASGDPEQAKSEYRLLQDHLRQVETVLTMTAASG